MTEQNKTRAPKTEQEENRAADAQNNAGRAVYLTKGLVRKKKLNVGASTLSVYSICFSMSKAQFNVWKFSKEKKTKRLTELPSTPTAFLRR